MKLRHAALTTAVLGVIALFGPQASAWDTKEVHSEEGRWLSIYLCSSGSSSETCNGNEHERLANRALNNLISGNNPYTIGSPSNLVAIDLNASYLRFDHFGEPDSSRTQRYQRQPSEWSGPLEERTIPNPPHFSGVADFTYSIYDWINKNDFCPPIASGELRHCHNYAVWMGAGFNSSHFGSQASESYQQLHQTAVNLARHARSLRESVTGAGAATREAHFDAVREAEYMALAYEAAAQHFLQDRWSSGHMWERWNAPDYARNPYNNDIGAAAVIGAVSGILHGSEAVLGQPALLSSPRPTIGLFGRDGVQPAMWTRLTGGDIETAVGDYRLNDMFRGRVGAQYGMYANTDWPLNVMNQRVLMMDCLAGGFREVITSFGQDSESGGYGIEGIQLTSAGSQGVPGHCFDAWATNRSMAWAWGPLNISDTATGTILPLVVRMLLPGKANIDPSEVDTNAVATGAQLIADYYGVDVALTVERASLARISSNILWYGAFYGDGTEMARGGMGSLGEARPGNAYPGAPDYLEPANLSSLPEEDPRGRDRNTIFGFFNRAHAGEFCQGTERRLENLRVAIRSADTAEERDRARGVCQLLAQRIFAETRTDYRGEMRSYQVAASTAAGATSVPEAEPLCAVQPTGAVTSGPQDDSFPYYLHQGYVPFNPISNRTNQESWADTFTDWGYSQASVANWCDRTPVIDVVADDEDRARRDVVDIIQEADQRIELYGINFGAGRGRVLIGQNWDSAVEVTDIVRWYDDRITLRLGEQFDDITFNEEDEAYVFIEKESSDEGPLPGYRSVGRFVLLNEVPRPTITSMRVSRGNEVFYEYEAPEETEEEIGPFDRPLGEPAPEPAPFRPITPGMVTVEIEFDMNIDRDEAETRIALGDAVIDGEFTGRRRWRGGIDLSELDYYSGFRGVQPVSVYVKAEEGEWIDGEPSQSGSQPDVSNRVVVDEIPIIVERVQVRGRGRVIYDASWAGGPDLDEEPSLLTTVLGDPERMLDVGTARVAPAQGQGRIRIELSTEVENAPVVQVGGATAEMRGDGTRWQGTFDFAQALTAEENGETVIRITAQDAGSRGLDADPRSVAQLIPPDAVRGSNYWARYEANRGDAATSSTGGADTWHRIGEPPAVSMVIVLDASGSMNEYGRLENARNGIRQTLDNLPEDTVVELAGVVFYDCGNIQVIPFTRNVASVRDRLLSVSAYGFTSLAGGYASTRNLFASSANPGAQDWRYLVFTDGVETCEGDVAGAAQNLEQLLRDHRGLERGNEPEEPEEEVARERLPEVECHPSSWRRYSVSVNEHASGFDDVILHNHWFIERALPDGRCFARLETKDYYVHYGTAGSAADGSWGINSRASNETSDFGSSSNGVDDLNRVRQAANTLRNGTTDLATARQQIDAAVRAALQDLEDS